MPKGEKNKLTVFERLEIFNLKARLHQEWEDGLKVSTKNIATKYGISQAAVYKIWNNENGQLDYIIALEKLVKLFSSAMDTISDDLKTAFMEGLTGKEREIIGEACKLSSNEFDDLFGGKKETTTKREPIPTVSTPVPTQREPTPTVREPTPTTTRAPYAKRKRKTTAKVDVEKLTKEIVSQVTSNLSETIGEQLKNITPPSSTSEEFDQDKSYKNLINDLGMTVGTLQAELKSYEPLKEKLWNEVNRLKWMNSMDRKGKKGFKRHEMFTFFGSTTVSYGDIDLIVDDYKKMGLLQTGRNGWMKLTTKGKEHYQSLLEANT